MIKKIVNTFVTNYIIAAQIKALTSDLFNYDFMIIIL